MADTAVDGAAFAPFSFRPMLRISTAAGVGRCARRERGRRVRQLGGGGSGASGPKAVVEADACDSGGFRESFRGGRRSRSCRDCLDGCQSSSLPSPSLPLASLLSGDLRDSTRFRLRRP
jgi:hypothetical protein